MKTVTALENQTCGMVVDDNKDMLTLLSDLIEQLIPVKVECFTSPEAALEAFQATPEKFRFVITDLEMPGMNGIQLCEHLHAIVPELKVLLSTGSRVLTEAEARMSGFCALLNKPFPLSAMERTLARVGVCAAETQSQA